MVDFLRGFSLYAIKDPISLSENEKCEIKTAFGISKSSSVPLAVLDIQKARIRRGIQEEEVWI